MAAIGVLEADVGKTILYALAVGIPTAVLTGPLLAFRLARGLPAAPSGPVAAQFTERPARNGALPGFAITVFTVLLPIVLMLVATAVDVIAPASRARAVIDFIGDPIVALLIAAVFSFYSLGFARGFRRAEILKFSEDCLAPLATTLLIIGAGGGFSRVLAASGVGDSVAALAAQAHLPPLVLGWLIAALIRIALGSATVSITTAAGILAPMVAAKPGVNLELLVVAMGAGSLILSHVNDAGFWLVKEYLNLSVAGTLRTWSVVETAISLVALALVLLLNLMV
jgi:GntP family gluconate:H+ symporter